MNFPGVETADSNDHFIAPENVEILKQEKEANISQVYHVPSLAKRLNETLNYVFPFH